MYSQQISVGADSFQVIHTIHTRFRF